MTDREGGNQECGAFIRLLPFFLCQKARRRPQGALRVRFTFYGYGSRQKLKNGYTGEIRRTTGRILAHQPPAFNLWGYPIFFGTIGEQRSRRRIARRKIPTRQKMGKAETTGQRPIFLHVGQLKDKGTKARRRPQKARRACFTLYGHKLPPLRAKTGHTRKIRRHTGK